MCIYIYIYRCIYIYICVLPPEKISGNAVGKAQKNGERSYMGTKNVRNTDVFFYHGSQTIRQAIRQAWRCLERYTYDNHTTTVRQPYDNHTTTPDLDTN